MKVKLLKKIRERFTIEYYPNRESEKKYKLIDNEPNSYVYGISNIWHLTKQSALNDMLNVLRWQYQSRSRKYKIKNIKNKVWYSNTGPIGISNDLPRLLELARQERKIINNPKRYADLIRSLSALKTEKEVINVKIKEVEDEIKQIEMDSDYSNKVCEFCSAPLHPNGMCLGWACPMYR